MKKLLLVNPVGQTSGYLLSKFSSIPPLSLAYIAAVTPSDWEVKIADENFGPILFEDADLVGITAFTSSINRAYEIAKKFRERSAPDVLDELQEIPGRFLFFLDDNLIGHSRESKKRAIDIFEGMIKLGLNKKWWMQTSIDSADDEQVLKLAAEAGCMLAFIGFETISATTLKEMKKGVNLRIGIENYKKVIDAFHSHGIGVVGAFILGNDHESPNYYKEMANFFVRSGIDAVQMAILTPLPGTQLMAQMEKEGRLLYLKFPEDWDKFRLSYVVHKPEGIKPETIYIGNNYIKNHIYSFPWNQHRLLRSFFNLKNPTNFYAVYRYNKALKKSWQGSHYFEKYPAKFPLFPS